MANAIISVLGRIAADPEARTTTSGNEMVKFRLAVTQGWGDRKTTGWYSVTVFGRQCKFVRDYCRKGDEVFVAGELEAREYEKDGVKRTSIDVTASSVAKTNGSKRKETGDEGGFGDVAPEPVGMPQGAVSSEDLPF